MVARLLFSIVLVISSASQAAEAIRFTVSETAGLRRFGYPVTASLECAQGSVRDTGKLRLLGDTDQDVAAQFTQMSAWPDGSVRGLDVDFAPSPGPHETIGYRVEIGKEPSQPPAKGLGVTELPEEIVVASSAISHRIRRDGMPLLMSVSFGGTEFLGTDGIRTTLVPGPTNIVKRGPFNVTVVMGGVRLEYVNTKSWVKIVQESDNLRELAVDGRFQLEKKPLLWDFGLGSWLYGTLAKPGQSVIVKHDRQWQVTTGPGSLFATASTFDGCGHFADTERVTAFGIADASVGSLPTIELHGDGRLRAMARRDRLTVYFHWVAQPIPVTAVTSPQAMIAPLKVMPITRPPGKDH